MPDVSRRINENSTNNDTCRTEAQPSPPFGTINRCSRRTIQPVGSLPGPPPRVLEPQIADELPDEADGEEPDGHRAERGKGERRVTWQIGRASVRGQG